MNKKIFRLSLAAVALQAGAAAAQEQQEQEGQLEEVTVTAERRFENIRNVPSSISTPDSEGVSSAFG